MLVCCLMAEAFHMSMKIDDSKTKFNGNVSDENRLHMATRRQCREVNVSIINRIGWKNSYVQRRLNTHRLTETIISEQTVSTPTNICEHK
jgi:hypothetical protein